MGLPPNAKFRACLLHSPGQRGHALLDLIEWIDPPTPETPPVLGNSPGIPRIALWIDSLEAAYVQLAQNGIEFEGVLGRPDRENGIEHVAFTRDPDGLIVELLEFPSDWTPPLIEDGQRPKD
jgi:catechol 2,3-dioxygenase-like lactoylglutathione lyase family enzyme